MLEPIYFSLKTPSHDTGSGALFSVGVPLPKGRFFAIQQLVCCRDDGKDVSAAVVPKAFWPDNSLKWVLVQGETTRQGLEQAGFTLCEPQQIPPYCKQQSPDITTTPDKVEVRCADTSWLIDTDQLFSGTQMPIPPACQGRRHQRRVDDASVQVVTEEFGACL